MATFEEFPNFDRTAVISNGEKIPSDHHINQVWLSSILYPALSASHFLGILKVLDSKALKIKEISDQTEITLRACTILVNLLVAAKFLVRTLDGSIKYSRQGDCYLRSSSPYSWGGMFERESQHPLVQQIIKSSKSTADPNDLKFLLTPAWQQNNLISTDADSITHSMHSESAATALIQAEAIDLSKYKSLIDIGGGSGVFSIALAEKFSHLSCTVADLPQVGEAAKKFLSSSLASSRLKFLPLDIFKNQWPKGFDSILMSNILHDWDDSTISFLLKLACESLPINGKIIINEMLHDGNTELEASLFSIVMLTRTLGRQLSFMELESAMVNAGFANVKRIETQSIFSIIEAVKV